MTYLIKVRASEALIRRYPGRTSLIIPIICLSERLHPYITSSFDLSVFTEAADSVASGASG